MLITFKVFTRSGYVNGKRGCRENGIIEFELLS